MNDVEKVGARIKAVRSLMKETQEEFAEHCDISTEAVSSIERNVYLPRLETLQKIAEYTGISPGSLLNDFLYVMHEETKTNEEGVRYVCYGINVYENNDLVKSLSDVFLDRITAENFTEMCNACQLHPTHLNDVIEDYS